MHTIKELKANHEAFYHTGATKDITFRLAALRRLEQALHAHERDILSALKLDLNKSGFEAYETELGLIYGELKNAISHLPAWAKPKRVPTPVAHFPSASTIFPEPYGTVLIMSPWNYPFQLTLFPLIGAIAAGNCCMLKPSEYSFHSAEVLERIVREVFDEKYVSLIRGGRAANQTLLDEQFDYIFFTGSPGVGHYVMECAAKHLTPVTLELGGKSPCIVEKTANVALAARRIVWGKVLNSGQTCIAPDYLLIHESRKAEFIAQWQKTVEKFFGAEPEKNEDYPKIINQKHFDRLSRLLKDGNILTGGGVNAETHQIAPTLIDGITPQSPIMQEEIFGPLFPILTFENMDEVYDLVVSRPKPLALYLFTRDKQVERDVLRTLSFGGGCINDTITHIANPNMPFGGVGNSGMGHYHGKLTFETFTHQRAVLKKFSLDIPLRYPPFKNHLNLLKMML